MKREVVVQSIGISPDGIELQWMVLPDDVRSEGHVVNSRSTAIAYATPAGLGELAVDLRTLVGTLGTKLLEQFDQLPVYDPPATEDLGFRRPAVDDDDDDEDVGMGDGV